MINNHNPFFFTSSETGQKRECNITNHVHSDYTPIITKALICASYQHVLMLGLFKHHQPTACHLRRKTAHAIINSTVSNFLFTDTSKPVVQRVGPRTYAASSRGGGVCVCVVAERDSTKVFTLLKIQTVVLWVLTLCN